MDTELLGTTTIHNPLNEDFHYRYDGQDLHLPANSVTSLPTPLARHAAKHLADKILIHNKSVFQDRVDGNGKKTGVTVPRTMRHACMLSLLNREEDIDAEAIMKEADEIIAKPPSMKDLEVRVDKARVTNASKPLKGQPSTAKK